MAKAIYGVGTLVPQKRVWGTVAKVVLESLTKVFGDVVAFKNLNLEAHDKEFLVLLGPSGCGKTTTLRCIAGLEQPTDGDVYIGDQRVTELEPKDRNVAMVFQSYALYPHMTVFKNIAFPLENARVPQQEIVQRVNATAKLLQIQSLLGRKPSQLSGGQRQRVALGRAIVREPLAFLMDEPLSNLDAKLRVYMRAELKKLQKDLGITTIYVTHDQVEAMTMADRIALMHQGKLQQCAPPKRVYDHPENQFVAGFIGSPPINFMEGVLTPEGILDLKEFRMDLPDETRRTLSEATGKEVVVGVRPQDVVVHKEEGAPGSVPVEVYTTEPMGDVTILDLKVGDIVLKVVVPPDDEAREGQRVYVSFPVHKIHVFDAETGDVIA